jgi:hypothetical protein
LYETIFRLCFDRYEGTLAGGQTANNKLDLERIEKVLSLRGRVAHNVASLVIPCEADLLVSTPRGGDWLTKDMAQILGIEYLLLGKDKSKNFAYFSGGAERVASSERVAIVDDLMNRRTNTNKVLALPGVAERAVAAVAIFDRNPAMEPALPIPQYAWFEEYIAEMLPESDPHWSFLS